MNTQIKRKDRPQILKTSQICGFCNRSIKKGSLAVFRKNKIFEHQECSVASNGYLGEDGFVERNRFGSPRCHLCGLYQEKLNIHIVGEHNIGVEEYKKLFSIPDNESLVGYTVEDGAFLLDSLSSDNSPTQTLVLNNSVPRLGKLGGDESSRTKSENPMNKKRKKKRK